MQHSRLQSTAEEDVSRELPLLYTTAGHNYLGHT